MQNTSSNFTTKIDTADVIYPQPRLYAEFNLNISNPPTITNNGSDVGSDQDYYDISSIIQGNRPAPSVGLAVVGNAQVAGKGKTNIYSTRGIGNVYKYYMSNGQSALNSTTISGVTAYAISGIDIQIQYATPLNCNKIVIGFGPNAQPVAYDVQVQTTVGGSWSTIRSNPSVNANKQLVQYFNGSTWQDFQTLSSIMTIVGLRLKVYGLNKSESFFSLTEMSCLLEKDISSDIVDMSIEKTISDPDVSKPFGTVSANNFNVTLDNSNSTYINGGSSIFAGLLVKNVKMIPFLGIDTVDFSGTNMEWIQQGIFWVDSWGNESDYNVSVTCTDFTKFLQEQALVPRAYVNKTVGQILQSIFNMLGFEQFNIWNSLSNDYTLPYFWHNTTDMAWDVITALCTTSQGVLFFDEFGVPQYVSRNSYTDQPAASTNKRYPPPVTYSTADSYVLTSQPLVVGAETVKPNIIDADHEFLTQINQTIVNYQVLSINKDIYGNLTTSSEWTPSDSETTTTTVNGLTTTTTLTSDDVSIMSGYLSQNMTSSQLFCYLDPTTAALFAFSGYLNIDGEVMSYDAREYAYYATSGTTLTRVWVTTQDQVNNINDNLTNSNHLGHSNYFTGKFRLIARGLWGTSAAAHNVAITNWNGFTFGKGFNAISNPNIIKQYKSTLSLKGTDKDITHINLAEYDGSGFNTKWVQLGTQVMFVDDGSQNDTAGLFFNLNGTNRNEGIFIDVKTSTYAIKTKQKEITAYYCEGTTYVPLNSGTMFIAPSEWYQIDVVMRYDTGIFYYYDVYINGNFIFTFHLDFNMTKYVGVYVRADTSARFEYFYGVSTANISKAYEPALYGLLDKINGSYVSNLLSANVLYHHANKSPNWKTWVAPIFDDFGPYVHEIRPFSATFENPPVFGAQIYVSNDKYLDVIDFNANAFSATFYMVNKMRDSINASGVAVMQGDDVSQTDSSNVITQSSFIYGYTPTQSSQKVLTVNNKPSVDAYGINQLTFSSQWTQTDSEATDLGTWCTKYWGQPIETLTSNVWINPACQLMDSVYYNYTQKNIQKPMVLIGINIGWSNNGFTGSVTLQDSLV